jgi:hypothetical protein
MLSLVAAAALFTAPVAASADNKSIQGRTGLPTVFDGKDNVWMDHGDVELRVQGNNLYTIQDFVVKYPGPPLEKGDQMVKLGVREDYVREVKDADNKVNKIEATGFESFGVWVDGTRIPTSMTDWELNDKKDTATRWRQFSLNFRPGETKRLRIVSVAPLGREGTRRTVEFVSKDVGGWRDKPTFLDIRVNAPTGTTSRVVHVEPNPKTETEQTLRWTYKKASPNRDVFVLLPENYQGR